MAMTINREMTEGLVKAKITIKNKKTVFNGLQNVLFSGAIATDQDHIKYKYGENGIHIPSEGIRGTDPTRVNFGVSFKEDYITPAYFNPEIAVNLQNVKNRFIDEPEADAWSVKQRELYFLAEGKQSLADGFTALKEKMCADVLLSGKYTSKEGEMVYPMDSTLLSLAGANLSTKPLEVLSKAALKIVAKGKGVRINKLILNPEDAITLCQSTAWQAMLDVKNLAGHVQAIQASDLTTGFGYVGRFAAIGSGPIEVYSYCGLDEEGNYLLTKGKAILCGDSVGTMGYAGLLVNENGVQNEVAAKDLFVVATEENGYLVQTKVMAQTAPAPILTQIDRFGVITGIN